MDSLTMPDGCYFDWLAVDLPGTLFSDSTCLALFCPASCVMTGSRVGAARDRSPLPTACARTCWVKASGYNNE